jgi:hypothetical protein
MRRYAPSSTVVLAVSLLLVPLGDFSIGAEDAPIDVGDRRQLFVDGLLIDNMDAVRQVLHHPVPREIAIKPEHPWEEHGVSYMVAFRDGDKFRAWYRVDAAALGQGKRRAMTAYAESDDGIHWRKPKLGILDFDGSNDYVEIGKTASQLGIGGSHAKTVTAWAYTRAFNGGGIFECGTH